MSLLSKIAIFAAVIAVSNYLVSLVFRYAAKKTKAVHLCVLVYGPILVKIIISVTEKVNLREKEETVLQ